MHDLTSYNSCCSLRSGPGPQTRVKVPCSTSGSGKGFSKAKNISAWGRWGWGTARSGVKRQQFRALPELVIPESSESPHNPAGSPGIKDNSRNTTSQEKLVHLLGVVALIFFRAFSGFMFLLPERIRSQCLELGVRFPVPGLSVGLGSLLALGIPSLNSRDPSIPPGSENSLSDSQGSLLALGIPSPISRDPSRLCRGHALSLPSVPPIPFSVW